jgi:hypothetical protein
MLALFRLNLTSRSSAFQVSGNVKKCHAGKPDVEQKIHLPYAQRKVWGRGLVTVQVTWFAP